MELVNGQLVFNSDELWNLTDVLAVIIGGAIEQFVAQELNTYPTDMESVEEWKAGLTTAANALLEEEPDYDSHENFDEFSDLMAEYVKRREAAIVFVGKYFHLLWD